MLNPPAPWDSNSSVEEHILPSPQHHQSEQHLHQSRNVSFPPFLTFFLLASYFRTTGK